MVLQIRPMEEGIGIVSFEWMKVLSVWVAVEWRMERAVG